MLTNLDRVISGRFRKTADTIEYKFFLVILLGATGDVGGNRNTRICSGEEYQVSGALHEAVSA